LPWRGDDDGMTSSSDSEDDEKLAKSSLAVEPTFGFGCQKQKRMSGDAERKAKKSPLAVASETRDRVEKKDKENPRARHDDDPIPLGSNGQAVDDVGRDEEEFPKPYSLDVTPEMQRFIAKKLSKALDKMIDEVKADDSSLVQRKKKKESKSGIFLCSSSQTVISARDISRSQECTNETRKKPQLLRRRHLENELDEADAAAKFRAVAVSADWVKSSKF